MSGTFHFPADTVTFLRALRENNDRDWFTANKARYETAWKAPAETFADLMSARLDEMVGTGHASKIFRIFRDVRFSKDKTPYNTHIHISFFSDEKRCQAAHWFFGLDTENLTVGTGQFGFEKEELEHYRRRITGDDGVALKSVIDRLAKKDVRLNEPELKRVPRGLDAEHPRADLLRHKSLSAWLTLGPAERATEGDLVALCARSFKTLKPVYDWLQGA